MKEMFQISARQLNSCLNQCFPECAFISNYFTLNFLIPPMDAIFFPGRLRPGKNASIGREGFN